jgi:hypothetical protein
MSQESGRDKKEWTHIFVGCHVTVEYMGPVKVILDDPYICRFLAQTDEYNITFIDPETDEYNLNIFIGVDEFKRIGEWMKFPCSVRSGDSITDPIGVRVKEDVRLVQVSIHYEPGHDVLHPMTSWLSLAPQEVSVGLMTWVVSASSSIAEPTCRRNRKVIRSAVIHQLKLQPHQPIIIRQQQEEREYQLLYYSPVDAAAALSTNQHHCWVMNRKENLLLDLQLLWALSPHFLLLLGSNDFPYLACR